MYHKYESGQAKTAAKSAVAGGVEMKEETVAPKSLSVLRSIFSGGGGSAGRGSDAPRALAHGSARRLQDRLNPDAEDPTGKK